MIAVGRFPRWYDPEDDRTCRIAWSRLAEPGDVVAWALVAALGAGEALRTVVEDDGSARSGAVGRRTGRRGDPFAEGLARWRVRLPATDPRHDLLALQRVSGRVVVPGDDEWPSGLDDLGEKRPFCLWVRGSLSLGVVCERSVAIVGARASTPYGEHVAADLAAGCAEEGVAVVSGAAYGIDAAAHRGALSVGGATVAVLACGVDRAYPRGNEGLIERIGLDGCVVAEVPPSSAPTRWRFLERNRLIAALTGGTVVVEAAWRSGAISTATRAIDLGRPVGAVPGPVTGAMSAGCHRLLRSGSVCVTDAAELVQLVSPIGTVAETVPEVPEADHDGLDDLDLRVLDALAVRKLVPLDRLARTAGLAQADVAAALGRLEMQGLAERRDGGWRRAPRDRRASGEALGTRTPRPRP